jgi:hypothetical protein
MNIEQLIAELSKYPATAHVVGSLQIGCASAGISILTADKKLAFIELPETAWAKEFLGYRLSELAQDR